LLDRCLDAVTAALLLVLCVPVFAWCSICAEVRSSVPALQRDKSPRTRNLQQQIAGEFNFERAIEAYEDLIDSTFAEERL
jgi:hypothetical protein